MENRVPQRKLKIVPKTQPLLALKRCLEDENNAEEHSCTGSSSSVTDHHEQRNSRMIRVEEGNREHQIMEQKLVSGLMSVGMQAAIQSIEKNEFSSSVMKKAKLQSFSLFAKAVEEKSGFGNGNMQFAWLGVSNKEELTSILQHGFHPSMNKDGSFGHGVYLCPHDFPLGCLNSAMADENGVRHVLYCRVILGKTELVRPGSRQWHPTSQEFDCGVDDLVFPKKYIVWSTNVNTHILPLYIISFTISTLNAHNFFGVQRNSVSSLEKPNSSRITFPSLVSELEKFLPPQIMQSITTYVKDHREGKITRLEMVKRLRRLAGDELLIKIVKAQRDMQINTSMGNLTGVKKELLRHGS